MIHRCRPDIEAEVLVDEVRRALSARPEELDGLPAAGPRRLFAAPSAREALLWFLGRAGIGQGHDVALPALMCPVVADVILKAGARPVAYGVSCRDFSPSVELCEAALSAATRAVIVPHLYGIPANLEGFQALCEARGLLLIEDCAPCMPGDDAGVGVGTVGGCAVYSLKYDKPLALGWGGAIALSPEVLAWTGEPEFPAVSPREERLIAVAFALQHCLTDGIRGYAGNLGMSHVLDVLLQSDALAGAAVAQLQSGMAAEDLVTWWRSCASAAAEHVWSSRLLRVRRHLGRVAAFALGGFDPASPKTGACLRPDRGAASLGSHRLPDAGLCQHLLAVQRRRLEAGHGAEHRARIASIYREGLDRGKFAVPEPAHPPGFWLRFPAALRDGVQARDELCARLRQSLDVEIGPYNWSLPVHRAPSLSGKVRLGPDLDDTERLVSGLLNLPVHAQVSEDRARRIVQALNRGLASPEPEPTFTGCLSTRLTCPMTGARAEPIA